MGGPQGPWGLLHIAHPLLCLLCLLPPLLKAAVPRQAPGDQRPWALLEQYCHTATTLTNLSGALSYCNATLDQIGTCWPRSVAGALVERPCPEDFNGVKYNTTRNAYRECLENGTWASRLNYSQCVPILEDKRQYELHFHIAHMVNYLGHCVSMAALMAAFLLFLALRSIRCLRNVIHWNLIGTFILRNVTWFLLQLIDHEVHESNEVWCRCITTVFNYFVVTNFFWMFVEGCYLHTAIVMTYSTERLRKWLFLFIGWCVPCPLIIAWALGKLYYENKQCWFGKGPGDLVDYIYQGPILLVLLVDQLCVSVQHRQDPDDKTAGIHHVRDHPVQEGGEGHPGAPAAPGHHLHALPGQPRRGRPVADRVHLFQLLPAVLPGLLRVCLLLLPKWRGARGRAEAVAPVAGPSLPPSPGGAGHVPPHLAHSDQLPQHEADGRRVTAVTASPPLPASRHSSPSSSTSRALPARSPEGQREGDQLSSRTRASGRAEKSLEPRGEQDGGCGAAGIGAHQLTQTLVEAPSPMRKLRPRAGRTCPSPTARSTHGAGPPAAAGAR